MVLSFLPIRDHELDFNNDLRTYQIYASMIR